MLAGETNNATRTWIFIQNDVVRYDSIRINRKLSADRWDLKGGSGGSVDLSAWYIPITLNRNKIRCYGVYVVWLRVKTNIMIDNMGME